MRSIEDSTMYIEFPAKFLKRKLVIIVIMRSLSDTISILEHLIFRL